MRMETGLSVFVLMMVAIYLASLALVVRLILKLL